MYRAGRSSSRTTPKFAIFFPRVGARLTQPHSSTRLGARASLAFGRHERRFRRERRPARRRGGCDGGPTGRVRLRRARGGGTLRDARRRVARLHKPRGPRRRGLEVHRARAGDVQLPRDRRVVHHQEARSAPGRARGPARGFGRVRVPQGAFVVGGDGHHGRRRVRQLRGVRVRAGDPRHAAGRAQHHRRRGAGALPAGRASERVRVARVRVVRAGQSANSAARAGGALRERRRRAQGARRETALRRVRRVRDRNRLVSRRARRSKARQHAHRRADRHLQPGGLAERRVLQGARHRAEADVPGEQPVTRTGHVALRVRRRGVRRDADELPEPRARRVQRRGGHAGVLRPVHHVHARGVERHLRGLRQANRNRRRLAAVRVLGDPVRRVRAAGHEGRGPRRAGRAGQRGEAEKTHPTNTNTNTPIGVGKSERVVV